MTGIERLRKLSEDVGYTSLWNALLSGREDDWGCERYDGKTLNNELLSIADQIEREQDAMVADSPYEALPPEDREAIAWVRAHGGLDHVKAEWRSRVPYDKHERARRRLLDHIAECETALGRRNQRIDELGRRVGDLTRENAELRKRAMPEGYEWPRYEDGAPVQIGGEFVGKDGKTYTAKQIQFIGKCFSLYDFCDQKPQFNGFYGERVRRPAVLAADGEPPDSWERIEEDIADLPCSDYCDIYRIDASDTSFEHAMARDIVRRCKALAERERGE